MDTYRIRVILISGIQFRTGYQNQAKSSLEQGQVCGGPAAPPPPPPPGAYLNEDLSKKASYAL